MANKDEEYRHSLTPQQLAQLPPNPSGDEELSEKELDDISGGVAIAKGWNRVKNEAYGAGSM